MRAYQLLTYHLTTAEATKCCGAMMAGHITSLRTYGIKAHGIFTSPSRHNQVLVLVSYPEGTDPIRTGNGYLSSAEFQTNCAGFDWHQVIRQENIWLDPLI